MACAEAYEGESKSVESTAILNSLDGHPDFLLVNYKQGYAVFFRETGELLEYSLDDTSAYKGALGNLVYAGPGNYFAKTGEVFISLLDNSPVSISNVGKAATDIRSNFTDKADSALRSKVQYNDELEQLHRGVDNNTNSDTNINSVSVISLSQPAPTQPPASGRFAGAKYIQNADFFIRNPNHAVNNPSVHPQIPSIGACGVVAAQLMLNYHSYYTDRRIIPTTGNGVTFRATNYGSLEFWPDFQIAAGNDNALCTNIGTTDDFFLNLLTRGGGAGMLIFSFGGTSISAYASDIECCDGSEHEHTNQVTTSEVNGMMVLDQPYLSVHYDDGTMGMILDETYDPNEIIFEPFSFTHLQRSTVRSSGRPDNQSIVAVFLGDGFAAGEQQAFLDRVTEAANYMITVEPFNYYKDYLTVYAVHSISNESGASRDHGGPGIINQYD